MQKSTFSDQDGRPETDYIAAALSVVPGLGQIYNGESREGILFFCAGAASFMFVTLIWAKGSLVAGAKFLGTNSHIYLNSDALKCLSDLDIRSPQMLLLCLLLSAFIVFCLKDAMEGRLRSRQRKACSTDGLKISEAASASFSSCHCRPTTMALMSPPAWQEFRAAPLFRRVTSSNSQRWQESHWPALHGIPGLLP
jgi:TM2 domain-containing membrane protein YozV